MSRGPEKARNETDWLILSTTAKHLNPVGLTMNSFWLASFSIKALPKHTRTASYLSPLHNREKDEGTQEGEARGRVESWAVASSTQRDMSYMGRKVSGGNWS